MDRTTRRFLLLAMPALAAGCDGDEGGAPDAGADAALPYHTLHECLGEAPAACGDVAPLSGTTLVITELAVGNEQEGFDLNNADGDCDPDTEVDNRLAIVGSFLPGGLVDEDASFIASAEMFGLDSPAEDDCVDVAIYFANDLPDRDGDGARAGRGRDDCDDHDPARRPGAKEIPDNRLDDDCDGRADESDDGTPSADAEDRDGDGVTLADGDCDDRPETGAAFHPALGKAAAAAAEICGDGLDQDCDGVADDDCGPFDSTDGSDAIVVLSDSLTKDRLRSLVVFEGGRVQDGVLSGGPSSLELSLTLADDLALDLRLDFAFLRARIEPSEAGVALREGLIAGAISARAMDAVPNPLADMLGGTEEDTLLDVWVTVLGQIVGLLDPDGYAIADVDVDGDGLERFGARDLDGNRETRRADTCIDGDGTVVEDTLDAEGNVGEECTAALDEQGNPRFQDGWSLALRFSGEPVEVLGIEKGGPLK